MEINVEKYLSDEEIKEVVIDEVRTIIRDQFKTNDKLRSDVEVNRIVGNIAIYQLRELIDNTIPGFENLLKEKVVKELKEMDVKYHIFRKKDAWQSENSPATEILHKTIKENETFIQDKAITVIEEYDYKTMVEAEILQKAIAIVESQLDSLYAIQEKITK